MDIPEPTLASGRPTDSIIIEQYKAYLQDVGNIGVRHENSRRFYLAVPSALFALLALAGKDGVWKVAGPVQHVVAVVGIVLCVAWYFHMQAFQAIYLAKFNTLRTMERQFNLFHIFETEWEGTGKWRGLKDDPRYKIMRYIDRIVPIVFLGLFVSLFFIPSK